MGVSHTIVPPISALGATRFERTVPSRSGVGGSFILGSRAETGERTGKELAGPLVPAMTVGPVRPMATTVSGTCTSLQRPSRVLRHKAASARFPGAIGVLAANPAGFTGSFAPRFVAPARGGIGGEHGALRGPMSQLISWRPSAWIPTPLVGPVDDLASIGLASHVGTAHVKRDLELVNAASLGLHGALRKNFISHRVVTEIHFGRLSVRARERAANDHPVGARGVAIIGLLGVGWMV